MFTVIIPFFPIQLLIYSLFKEKKKNIDYVLKFSGRLAAISPDRLLRGQVGDQ